MKVFTNIFFVVLLLSLIVLQASANSGDGRKCYAQGCFEVKGKWEAMLDEIKQSEDPVWLMNICQIFPLIVEV